MKKLFAIIIAVVATAALLAMPASATTYSGEMDTKEYNVSVVVGEDNVLDITERITVDFNVPKHGIYRYIPYILQLDREINGQRITKRIRTEITDINVNDEFTHENDGLFKLIIIGDEDITLTGRQTYVINYKMKIYDDGIDTADMFYLNLVPAEWETDIENFSAKITFEKPLPEDADIHFYKGAYGTFGETDYILSNTDPQTINIDLPEGLMLGQTVTADIILPEGYYVGEANTDGAVPAALIAAAIFTAAAALLYFIFGRDQKPIPVVNFYPPKGLTSAEIGHIIDGYTDQKDIISLLIYWAHKGYLEIHQDGDDFTFVRRGSLPATAKRFESVMFNGLFATGDTVRMASLKNRFYTTMNLTMAETEKYFKVIPENRIYTRSSTVARVISLLLCGLPLALTACACLFAAGCATDSMMIITVIIWMLSAIMCAFNIGVWDKKHTGTKGSFRASAFGVGVLTVVLALAAAVAVAAFSGEIVPMALGAAGTLAAMAFAVPTNKRTKENTRLLGEILGFKNFIEFAELDRLKVLVEEDPQYFYGVIPFAYVLGLSDKWAKKFESIAIEPPTWYYGYDYPFTSYMFWHSFNNSMDRCRANMVSVPQQSKGSTGGFGGGGGFSGGGFGGGGGGSW